MDYLVSHTLCRRHATSIPSVESNVPDQLLLRLRPLRPFAPFALKPFPSYASMQQRRQARAHACDALGIDLREHDGFAFHALA
jgi:hypothetical protein